MTPGRLRLLVGVTALAVLGVVGFFSFRGADQDRATPAVDVTDPSAFDLPALEGDGRVRLADFAGTPVVVNFFASWCGPCDTELPVFADAARKLEGKVRFVAVNSQELNHRAAVRMAERHELEEAGIATARDVGGRAGGSQLHDALGRGMPINAFYDASGTLLDVGRGRSWKASWPRCSPACTAFSTDTGRASGSSWAEQLVDPSHHRGAVQVDDHLVVDAVGMSPEPTVALHDQRQGLEPGDGFARHHQEGGRIVEMDGALVLGDTRLLLGDEPGLDGREQEGCGSDERIDAGGVKTGGHGGVERYQRDPWFGQDEGSGSRIGGEVRL